ncbi:TRAP transporter, 4TM/12TM fusion protein [Archaeoglobus sulfaticallidus PM70-1]|uniref:TRAP transporter, 4TM/12TM fusion protein n=1 Tax=Archaeoglobus sulfaticallidus PM70-1 TaxID=387631 RepID=N0BNL0_9EURY|nr:TRAP transporter permease [Archaeoglobus sulfaticallidus]AGK61910.1 TRAP transporter, 4TM/12TM fusion protein [Archaeoglobus sulfaticallidus PM70-1]
MRNDINDDINENIDVTELEKKFLHERELKGKHAIIVSIIAILFSSFHIINGSYTGILQYDIVKSVHLAFAVALAFLVFPMRKNKNSNKIPFYDFILAGIGFYLAIYLAMNYRELLFKAAIGYSTFDYIIAGLAVIFVLEATRRVVNPALVVIALVFIFYAKYGANLPGVLSHPEYTWKEVLEHLYFTKEGIFGTPLAVSSSFVVLFVIFGAFLEKSGAGKFFIDLAYAFTGWMVGGPAKAAVVSSALMGTISGSSVANTVTTGAFTIPLMKKVGYKPEFAGAVEPAASTGGQIMPPIMGAAAFVMAEFVGIPYIHIVYAAIIPAFLYFFGVFSAVDFEARKENLRGIPRSELKSPLQVLKEGWFYLVPLFIIIYMLVNGYTPILAAVYSIFSVIAIIILEPIIRNKRAPEGEKLTGNEILRNIIKTILSALEHGGRSAVTVAMACASAGIIVGVVTLTGLGFKLASSAISVSQGYILIILVITMFVSLILGMGVPTTANYIITSTIAAPAIITFMAHGYGMSVRDFLTAYPELVLPAHMFVFYFGVAADLTPPVALAAYAGSAIAKSDPWKTGINAVKIGIGKYLVPYLFIFSPAILLIGVRDLESILNLILLILSIMFGIMAINATTIGCLIKKLSREMRLAMLIAGILLLIPNGYTKIIGFLIFTAIFLNQYGIFIKR